VFFSFFFFLFLCFYILLWLLTLRSFQYTFDDYKKNNKNDPTVALSTPRNLGITLKPYILPDGFVEGGLHKIVNGCMGRTHIESLKLSDIYTH